MDYFNRAKKFRTKKRLGQNFLIDGDTIDAIIELSDIKPDDTVIEIGAGAGFVTEKLVKCAKEVIAIELDEDAVRELEKLDAPNLRIVHADILKTNFSKLTENKVKVVANIPYYITSPIIAHLLGEVEDLQHKNRCRITDIMLMVQEEVAQRMAATPQSPDKRYGLLTILSQFWADVEIVRRVPAKSFYPAPKINSALVKLTVRDEPRIQVSDYKTFKKIIKAAFAQRRKTLKNCLGVNVGAKDKILTALSTLGFDENIRGEKLSIEQFGQLSELMK
jgi:16S rRNA (adenine1518-N6/adenine1519-N6)-dimethyltransferase